MKVMSDKEFDKAFKSSFEDFEVEPTAKSWENISAQLNDKPKGKKFPIFWLSAAASVVIVLSIGISIYQKPADEIIKLRAKENPKNNIVDIEQTSPQYSNNNKTAKVNNDVKVIEQGDKLLVANSSTQKNNVKRVGVNAVATEKINASEKNNLPDATISPKANVLSINNIETVIAETKPVRKPTVTEKIIAEEEARKVSSNNNQTALATNTNDENLNNEGATGNRKLKIKSVGDLVNFVVAKVDKRDEKIIKISKTDESDNEITGINLGLFKFRKAEK